jgi:hypothetical protein
MATKLYLLNTASDLDFVGAEDLAVGIGAPGAGITTGVADTVAGTAAIRLTRDTTGDVNLAFWTPPLNAVTISASTVTCNLWMSESNMSANVGARIDVFWYSNDGLTNKGVIGSFSRGVELPVTTRAAQNFTGTATSRSILAGDRIALFWYGAAVGTMAAGHTFNGAWAGSTGGADGDSWVEFTETITEQSAGSTYTKAGYGKESG